MKTLRIIVTSLLLALSVPVFAQMTDEQVVEYVKDAASQGKGEEQIAKELLAKGVTEAQAKRIMAKYEAVGAANASITDQALSGTVVSRNSRSQTINEGLETTSAGTSGLTSLASSTPDLGGTVFGHELFSGKSLTFEPNENVATPLTYQLGPGDEVIIEIWGLNEASFTRTITPEGKINIEQVGPIQLSGLTIEEATAKIRKALSKRYSGISGKNPSSSISVTLGNIRTIKVNVMGEVATPGTYRLSSFSTVFNALYRAGGVNDNGTLRAIRLVREGKQIATIDVYSYLFEGLTDCDLTLKEDDIIIVPPYQNIVSVSGGVKRPMGYELKDGQSVEDLIAYAGGFSSNAYQENINLVRNTGREMEVKTIKSSEFATFVLEDGDKLTVGSNLDRYANKIEVRGYVFRPGMYELGDEINSVRTLVEFAGGLKEDAFTSRAVLLREKEDLSLETMAVNLKEVLSGGMKDIPLKKNDVLVISGKYELEDRGTLTINGMVANPGVFPFADNTTLEDLILQAGGLLEGASTARVDVSRRLYDPAAEEYSDALGLTYTFAIQDGLCIDEAQSFILEPYDVVSVRRSPGFRPQKFAEVSGEVLFPGSYVLLKEGERLSDLIERCGGLLPTAYSDAAMLLRKRTITEGIDVVARSVEDLKNMSSRDSLNVNLNEDQIISLDLDYIMSHKGSDSDIVLKEGDRVIIPEFVNTVQVLGEVMFPNTVVYKKGKGVGHYINSAGGFTQNAKRSKVYVVYMNGSATKNVLNNAKVEPGCTIIVPSKPERRQMTTSDVLATASVASSLTSVVAMLIRLF